MSRSALRLLGLLMILGLAACVSTPPTTARPTTILISIDGFRADYLDRGLTPNLSRLATDGVRGVMRPSFPSKTFPNHYTLVTGLRPDRHGIVDNVMEDPQIPGVTFRLADKVAGADPRWWNDGTPIWVSAERAGISTATMFWPGSDAAIHGVRPTHWLPFDQKMTAIARVDQVLTWLNAPDGARLGLATLYFDEVDTAGHLDGPNSTGVNAAIARTDAAVGRLVSGLAARGLHANLVIVADHGMAEVSSSRVILVEDLAPDDAGRTLALGAFMTVYPRPGREAEVERALLRPHANITCWRKADIPARYRYGTHRRVAPYFCLPRTGWQVTTRAWAAKLAVSAGAHGYDNFAPEMRAVFIASGPAFRSGRRVKDFDNVDVYPLIARLLGVKAEPNDGDMDQLAAALRH